MAYLALSDAQGGAAESLALLVRAVDPTRFEKRVVLVERTGSPTGDRLRRASEEVAQLWLPQVHHSQEVRVTSRGLARVLRRSAGPRAALVAWLRARSIDLLHVNSVIFAHALGAVREALPGLRVVYHVRELLPDDAVGAFLREEIARCSDVIIGISGEEVRPFAGRGDVVVLPNPFDFSALASVRGDLRRRLGVPPERLLVGMVSRFSRSKGHLEFLAAMRLLREAPGAVAGRLGVLIAGVPPTSPLRELAKRLLRPRALTLEFGRRVRALGLGDRLSLLPYTHEAAEVHAALDVLVRPSLAGDPWGRDVIEAMAHGKPVVATGTSPYYVLEGRTGFLVPPGDREAMAARVRLLLEDPERRRAMGAAGAARVREMCDLERHGAEVMRLYDQALGARDEGGRVDVGG